MECRRGELQAELEALSLKEERGPNLQARAEALLKLDDIPRTLFALAIESIEVGEKDMDTGRQPIHILWKF